MKIILYFGYSIQSNATATPPTRWKLKEFSKQQIYTTQSKIQHQMWKYTEWTERTNRTEPTESMDENRSLIWTLEIQLSRATTKQLATANSERERTCTEREKNCVYRTNITSYQTLDQWFYWAIFKRFIRMKLHRLLLNVCVFVWIKWWKSKKERTNNFNNFPAMYSVRFFLFSCLSLFFTLWCVYIVM